MTESEYNALSNRYLKEGILKRDSIIREGYIREENVYLFPSGQKGGIQEYFINDSLQELTIDIRGNRKRPIDSDDYKNIKDFFISDYGKPSEIGIDKTSNFEYVYWNDFRGNRIEMAYSSPDDDWLGVISIICVDKENKGAGALSHAYQKKRLSFVDDLETCKEAEDLALKDYNEGRYRFVQSGMVSQTSIDFVNWAKKKHGIDVRLTGSCISFGVEDCYSDKMIFLLSSKFGQYFMRDLYGDLQKANKNKYFH